MFLGIRTEYAKWFERMIEYGFEEGKDFNFVKNDEVRLEGNRQIKRVLVNHLMTIDMAKELAMIQRNDKGREARKYFIEVEKEWNTPEKVIARALIFVNEQLETAKSEIAIMKPKADFYDTVTNSNKLLSMDKVAKILDMGIGRNNLFKLLRENKWLMDNNVPYQKYVRLGYFKLSERITKDADNNDHVYTVTLVKQKGLDKIRKLLEENGYRSKNTSMIGA